MSKSAKVSNHIPDDLTFSILSKLALKSLKRFSCVRKSWSLLIQNPNFMNVYGKNFMSRNNEHEEGSCFILQSKTDFLLQESKPDFLNVEDATCYLMLSGERLDNKIKLDLPPPFQQYGEDQLGIYILGPVINGIVCIYVGQEPCVVLWNPTTQQSNLLPSSPTESPVLYEEASFHYHGFGYDHVNDDYKVIRYVSYLSDFPEHGGMIIDKVGTRDDTWEVYSLRNNSWKKLDLNMPLENGLYVGAFVYINGVCHWYDDGWFTQGKYEDKAYLVSFDLSNDVFSTTPMPSDMYHTSDVVFVRRHLLVLNDHIAFISYYVDTTIFHISILGQLGVKDSWTKIFTLGPLPCIEEPIGVGENGDLFFRRKDDELVWFNLSTHMIKELGIKGHLHFCQIVIYKESLLPIGQIND